MDEVRVGDAERSEALDRLGTLFADGYLDVGEFEERTGQAAVARTRGELSMLFDDLPAAPAPLELSLIHISEPTRRHHVSRMPSSA